LGILGDSWTVCLGNTTKSSKHAETMPAGRYSADWPPKSDEQVGQGVSAPDELPQTVL
jgi:hypothetical protein